MATMLPLPLVPISSAVQLLQQRKRRMGSDVEQRRRWWKKKEEVRRRRLVPRDPCRLFGLELERSPPALAHRHRRRAQSVFERR